MLQDVIKTFKDIALRHKGVRCFKYQGVDLINAQNNNKYYQVVLDDVSLHQLNITTETFHATFHLYIMGFGDDVLDIQNKCYTIACDIIAKIDNTSDYDNVLSIHDYSIMTFSRFTDDAAHGVKLDIDVELPNPVDLCELDDNFNDDPYEEPQEEEIDVPTHDVPSDLDFNTIKLPYNRC